MNGKLVPHPASATLSPLSVRLIALPRPTPVVLSAPRDGRPTLALLATAEGSPQSLPAVIHSASTEWDAKASPGGVAFVLSIKESARSWLSYVPDAASDAVIVSRKYGQAFFDTPHFIKHGESDVPISAMSMIDDTAHFVLFSKEADGGYGQYRIVPVHGEGDLEDARLIRSENDYLLYAKFLIPGAGAAHPGMLYCSRLNTDLQIVRPAARCLGNRIIVDFDADASDGRVAIFATTPTGSLLATGQIGGPLGISEEASAVPLTSASALISGSTVHFAAVAGAASLHSQVVTGTMALR